MNYLNGGYVMIDKADSDIFAKASGALNAGKPILWYENSTTCYYIDTISKSGDDIVLTKGGKTITITSSNVVTETGETQQHLYAYVLDLGETYETGVTMPNGHNIVILSDKKFTDTIKDGEYNVLSGSYEYSSQVINIFRISINEGDVEVLLDSADNNVPLVSNFDNSIYEYLGNLI